MASPCKCSDCTRCPYDWCIDEDKDNDEAVKKDSQIYYQQHKAQILARMKAQREAKKAQGLCVRCNRKAIKGVYCGIHAEYMTQKSRLYEAKRKERRKAI